MRCIARRRGVRILDVCGRSDNAARCCSCRRAPAGDCGTALRRPGGQAVFEKSRLPGGRTALLLEHGPAPLPATFGVTRCARSPSKAELDALCAQLAERATVLCLAEGDLLLVDNFRALHGRGMFQARYDGTDRWMRKLTVVRDLRRSRRFRSGAEGRVISLFDESTPQTATSH
nr:TauD/TfdA family dioxygenase [Streptomyces sp. NBC_00857]